MSPRRIDELFFELRARTEGLSRDLDESQRQLGKWSQFVAAHPVAVTGAVAAGLLEIGIKATEMAEKTDAAMRRVAASLPTATTGIAAMGHELDAIAVKAGRATEEIEAAAVQAAQGGAASAAAVAQIVQAATTFSDATGTSLSASIGLIQQLMREFHLSSDDALKTIATLAEVAQHAHVPVDDLLSAFSGASPVFLKFGINADTGTRAIIALVSAGFGVRQVRQELNALDGDGIRKLAAQVPQATDAIDKLNTRAAITEGGADRLGQAIKNELNTNLRELGTLFLPAANKGLAEFLALLDQATDHHGSLGDRFRQGAQQVIDGLGDQSVGIGPYRTSLQGLLNRFVPPPPPALPEAFKSAIPDTALGIGVPQGGKIVLPPTKEDIAKAEAMRKALAELQLELTALEQTTDSAKSKSNAFGDAIAKWAEKARNAKLPVNDVAAALAILYQRQAAIASAEFFKGLDEKAKDTKDALDGIAEAIAKFSADPLKQFDEEMKKTLDDLAVKGAKITDDAKLKQFNTDLATLKTSYQAVRAALVDLLAAEKDIAAVRDSIDRGGAGLPQLGAEIERQTAKANVVQAKIDIETDPAALEKEKKELAEINQLLADLIDKETRLKIITKDQGPDILALVDKWAQVARGLVGVAQAIGKVDAATAALIQNAISFGESLGKAVKSKGADVGSDLEAIGSLGGLISAITNMGHAASQARQRAEELAASIGRLFTDLSNQNSGTKGTSLAERLAAESLSAADRRNQIERDLGGKKNQTDREKALDALNAAEAIRIAQLIEEYQLEQQQSREDYKVRELRADGLASEADALEFAETQQREYTKAIADGADGTTLAALAAAQAAEAFQHSADAIRKAAEDALSTSLRSTQQDEQLHHVTDPTKQFQDKAADYAALGGALGDFLKQFDLTTPEGIAKMDAALGDFLDEVKKNPGAFDLAGLSIDDFIAALLDLDSSATSVANAIETAAQKMADAENALSTSDAILGTSPTEQAQEKGNLYGFDLGDLSTQAGVDAAIARLQATFKALDPASADYKEKSREILNTIQSLRAITFDTTTSPAGGAGAAATSGSGGETTAIANAASALTEVTGNRMAEYLATILQVNRDELKAIERLVSSFSRPIITGPILPPMLPSWFGVPGSDWSRGSGSSTSPASGDRGAQITNEYKFSYELHFDGGTFLVDKKDMTQLAHMLLGPLSKGLADQLRASQRLLGDTSIPTS